MKTTYDKTTDAMYIYLKKGQISRTIPLSDQIIIDLDKKGILLGIEILDAKKQFGFSVKKIKENVFLKLASI